MDTATAYAPGKERVGQQLISGAFVFRFLIFSHFRKYLTIGFACLTCKNPLDFHAEGQGIFLF